MHELHRLPDDVLTHAKQCATYLHEVYEQYHAIDRETAVKNSTLLADIDAAMEDRRLRPETLPGWERAELDDGTPVYLQQPDNDSAPP